MIGAVFITRIVIKIRTLLKGLKVNVVFTKGGEKMFRLFLFDWIETYLNTPQIEMTADIEILFYLALSIIFAVVAGVVCAGLWIYSKIKK